MDVLVARMASWLRLRARARLRRPNEDEIPEFSRSSHKLCRSCCGINFQSLQSGNRYRHRLTVGDIRDGTWTTDCAFCLLLMKQLKLQYRDDDVNTRKLLEEAPPEKRVCLWLLNEAYFCVEIKHSIEDVSLEAGSSIIMVRTMTGAPFSYLYQTVNEDAIDTSSISSIMTAKRWLEDCLQNHDCSKSIFSLAMDQQGLLSGEESGEESGETAAKADCDITERPKRLIDLKAFHALSSDARLIEPESNDVRYTALSYCWGNVDSGGYKTTTVNLSSHLTRIRNSKMPLTIKHAFEITRLLGVRYIWIDALCILQDNVSDWEIESSKMGAIYSQALVTIAADWAPTADSGCYNRVSQGVVVCQDGEIEITSRFPSGDSSSLFFRLNPGVSPAETEASKLNSRAWACQERLLSPRIIHFTDKQLYWECRKHILPQDGMTLGRRPFESYLPVPRLILQIQPDFRADRVEGLLHLWYAYILAETYLERHLTVSSDKLPAVSALAGLWSRCINSPYLAGIWQKDLHLGLSWYKYPGPSSRPSSYRSPSWSWAALEGRGIRWTSYWSQSHYGQPRIKLIEANVDLEGQDPFGRVTGGFIKVIGRMQTFVPKMHGDWRGLEVFYTKNDVTASCRTYMDLDEDCPEELQGLLLHFCDYEHSDGHYSLLLLAPNPANSHQYIRKGFAEWNNHQLDEELGWKKGQGPWEGCKEQVITIV